MKLYKGKISILMPAYNEGEKIYNNLIYCFKIFKKFRFPFEIILIDDGSADNTKDMALKAAAEHSEIQLVSNIHNAGKGYALKNGFEHSIGDIIVFLDSDLEINPFQVGKLLKSMRDNNADIVIGSKRHKNSNVKYTFPRKVLSFGYYLMIKFLFNLNVTDTQAGIKIFQRKVLEMIFPKVLCKKYAFDVEILAIAVQNGFNIAEEPIDVVFSRNTILGRIKIKDVIDVGLDTMAIFYRMRILRYYDRK
ncbi:MAG: glycosyltransferase [bacterium]